MCFHVFPFQQNNSTQRCYNELKVLEEYIASSVHRNDFFRLLLEQGGVLRKKSTGEDRIREDERKSSKIVAKLVSLFFYVPGEPFVVGKDDEVIETEKMTKILIDMPSHDELATKRFLQRNAPISKQVLSLFLFPMTYLSGSV
jgi:hypothetical protein